MGNCNCSMKAVTDSRKSSDLNFARVMTDSGEILNLKGPKLVRQVLNEFPGYNIFSSNSLSTPLHDQELLLDGQFYYLHPVTQRETEHILVEEEEKTEQIRVSSSLRGSAMEVLPAQREGLSELCFILRDTLFFLFLFFTCFYTLVCCLDFFFQNVVEFVSILEDLMRVY